MWNGSCGRRLTRALVAALSLGTVLAPAALGAGANQCPEDSALGGWIRYQTTWHEQPISGAGSTGCDIEYTQYLRLEMLQKGPHLTHATIDATLPPSLKGSARETTVQRMLNAWRKHALLDPYYVSRIHYQIWTDGCIKVPGGNDAITGLGPVRTSGTVTLGEDSSMGFREAPNTKAAVGYFEFHAMSPEIDTLGSLARVDAIGRALAQDERAWRTDLPPGNQGLTTASGVRPGLLLPNIWPTTKGRSENPGVSYFLVEPTKCAKPDQAQQRDCIANPSKYVVIPFEGKSSWHGIGPSTGRGLGGLGMGPGWWQSSNISWKICCGCGQGQPPPDFPNKQPCPDTANEDAALKQNRDKDAAKIANLATLWKSYEEEMSKAQSHLPQFQTTIQACNIQDRLTALLAGTLGLFSPVGEGAIAAEGVEEAAEIKEAAEMLGEQLGDPGGTLLTVISKLMNKEDPTASVIPNETFRTFLEAAEAAEKAIALINGSNVTQLEERVEGCAGTIGLSYDTWKGANEYVDDLKEAMAKIPEAQKLVNDIRQLDTDLADLQYKAYAACVRRARCLKQPESSCDKLKPAGNWADVQ